MRGMLSAAMSTQAIVTEIYYVPMSLPKGRNTVSAFQDMTTEGREKLIESEI